MARVLIVEDEAMLLMIASITLEDEGHEVVTASNGRKGLEYARKGPVDLIVTDFMMPDVDGIEMLRTLREEGFDRPAIVTSAIPERQLPHGAEGLFGRFIPKPYMEDDLARTVLSVLDEA